MRMENTQSLNRCPKDVIIIPLFEHHIKDYSLVKKYDESLYTDITAIIESGDFKGTFGSSVTSYATTGIFKRIYLIGAGKQREFSLDKMRKLVASVDAAMQQCNIRGYTFFMPTLLPLHDNNYIAGKACSEAVVMSRVAFTQFKSKKEKKIKDHSVVFFHAPKSEFQKGLDDGHLIALNVNMVREVVNTPSNLLTPIQIAQKAEEIAAQSDGLLTCTVFDENKIKELNMNGILAVAQGSVHPPRFIILQYDGSNGAQQKPIVVVGKGVSFDSGGISIKPWNGMEKMKYDMAGSGAVLGIMKSVADLKLPLNVVGLIPTVENMPSGTAYKPGDVITMASGLTVEVISTDAEGRMILADALHYACEHLKPEAIVDMATLTGACVVALGNKASAILGNNRGLIRRFLQHADDSGERVWELPLWNEYDDMIKSETADIKNVGGPGAGTIVGAVFLKNFIKNTPWVHLDIANTAWNDNADKGYLCKGATGFGVRLVVEILRRWNQ